MEKKLAKIITLCYILNMSKLYYVSYETAKQKLNLSEKNECADRINLAYCNQLVKDAIDEAGVSDSEKQKYLEAIVLKLFNKCDAGDETHARREAEMVGVYEAVKDAVIWGA